MGVLKIAGRVVVDNDGLHSAIEKNGQIPLRKGLQPFDLDFIEGGGGYTLKLQYSINGSEPWISFRMVQKYPPLITAYPDGGT